MLQITRLAKAYGASIALRDVSFTAREGETLAVLGQNGAGKSTLVRILAGATPPSAGAIALDGKRMVFDCPRSALRQGVVLIPQELAYVPALSAAENILIGSWGGGGVVRQRRLVAQARRFAEQVGLDADLRAPMSQLSLAQCQLVEIAKALSRRVRVLLLDEPTAALSTGEAAQLFAALRRLRDEQVALIYISHRLDEIMTQADRVIVLRDGAVVAHRAVDETSREQLIQDMVGHTAGRRRATIPTPARRADVSASGGNVPVVTLSDVTHHSRGLAGVSLTVAKGEIVGLFGVRGGGQEELTKLLAGLRPHQGGHVVIGQHHVRSLQTPRQARRVGVMYVPSDRKRCGLVLGQGVQQNLTFPQLRRVARMGIMDTKAEQRMLASAADRLSLRYRDAKQPARELSGGNQQKLLLASRIYTNPPVLVIDEPSRGVDIAARDEIHGMLAAVAADGTAVIFSSSDVEECVALSDRLVVFRAGRVMATFSGADVTEVNALDAAGQQFEEG